MKNQLTIGISGLDSSGKKSTDKLLSYLQNTYLLDTIDYNYKPLKTFNLITKLKYKSKNYQLELSQNLHTYVNQISYPPNIVAHSFGCLLVIKALSLGMKVNNIFLFSPSVESDEIINTTGIINNAYIIYHPNDLILKTAKLLKFHDFGDMGTKGYDYPENTIKNVRYSQKEDVSLCEHVKELFTLNHSVYFLVHNISHWGQFVFTKINNSINKL
jgi:hypothetical protein